MKSEGQSHLSIGLESRFARRSDGQRTDKSARSRGQRKHPLLHVTELMLPPLRARIGLLSCGWAVFFLTLFTTQISRSQYLEYPVGGTLAGDQDSASLSVGTNGGVMVWEDNRSNGRRGRKITAVHLDSDLKAFGSDFQVNQQATGEPGRPGVESIGGGNTLFVWEVRRGSKPGLYARVLGADGKFLSSEFLVNCPTWATNAKRSMTFSGVFRGVEKDRLFGFREKCVNVREQSGHAALGALPAGGAVVAYHSIRKTETNTYALKTDNYDVRGIRNDILVPIRRYGDSMHDIYFQRLDAAGRKVGAEVLVNQYLDFNQRSPTLAVLPGGGFVVAWVCEYYAGGGAATNSIGDGSNIQVDLRARFFDSVGLPLGDEFKIATGNEIVPANPNVIARPDGGFTAFWSQLEGGSSTHWDVFGGVFNADGTSVSGIFRINEYSDGDQFAPKAAGVGDSQFVVWTSRGQDGSREGIYGRWLSAGVLSGNEFRINATTISRQINPTVAGYGPDRVVTVWSSFVGETGLDLFGSIIPVGEALASPLQP